MMFATQPFPADRQCVEPALQCTPSRNEASMASRATECRPSLLNCEDDRSLTILRGRITISSDAETMIQYARGHTSLTVIPINWQGR